jgi:transposase-like protein
MQKRQFSPEYKAKLVIEALREEKTVSEIAAREAISRAQLQNWKKEFLDNAGRVFSQSRDEREAQQLIKETQDREQDLMAKVGQLTVEVDWLKKKSAQVLGPDWESKSGYKKH